MGKKKRKARDITKIPEDELLDILIKAGNKFEKYLRKKIKDPIAWVTILGGHRGYEGCTSNITEVNDICLALKDAYKKIRKQDSFNNSDVGNN